jgi:hypothetical protein
VHVDGDVLVMPTVVVSVPAAPVPPTTARWSCDGWHRVELDAGVVVLVVLEVLVVVDEEWWWGRVVEVDCVCRAVFDADGELEHAASSAPVASTPTGTHHRRERSRPVPGGRPPGSRALTRRSLPA